MSQLAALVVLVALAAAATAQSNRVIPAETVKAVLNNNRLLTTYIDCVLDKGSCNADGRELRRVIPQALANDCATCTANQKQVTDMVIRHLRAKRPNDWAALVAKYDPKGEYMRRFAKSASQGTPKPQAVPAAKQGRAKTG